MNWTQSFILQTYDWNSSHNVEVFRDEIHLLYGERFTHHIAHMKFDGENWLKLPTITNQKISRIPALATFNEMLHMVHRGDTQAKLWHSTFDGNTWSPNYSIPGKTSKVAPVLASFGNRLHMLYPGENSSNLWHCTFNGQSWSPIQKVPNQICANVISLVEFKGKLHLLYVRANNNLLMHTTYDGTTWSAPNQLPQNARGKLLATDSDLFLFYSDLSGGEDTNLCYLSSSDGSSWSNPTVFAFNRSVYELSHVCRNQHIHVIYQTGRGHTGKHAVHLEHISTL